MGTNRVQYINRNHNYPCVERKRRPITILVGAVVGAGDYIADLVESPSTGLYFDYVVCEDGNVIRFRNPKAPERSRPEYGSDSALTIGVAGPWVVHQVETFADDGYPYVSEPGWGVPSSYNVVKFAGDILSTVPSTAQSRALVDLIADIRAENGPLPIRTGPGTYHLFAETPYSFSWLNRIFQHLPLMIWDEFEERPAWMVFEPSGEPIFYEVGKDGKLGKLILDDRGLSFSGMPYEE